MLSTPSTLAEIADSTDPDTHRCSDYLLVCRAHTVSITEGSWHFTLEASDGTPVFTAGDTDLGDLNRLTLLAAVRGLESIDGASSVTMLSNNRYLIRSLSDSLPRWRENDFVWEHFGRRIDVQHADLWRRIDRALSIHRVQACLISSRWVSAGHGDEIGGPESLTPQSDQMRTGPMPVRIDAAHQTPPPPASTRSAPADQLRRWLLTGEAAIGRSPVRRRFTAADLMESA